MSYTAKPPLYLSDRLKVWFRGCFYSWHIPCLTPRDLDLLKQLGTWPPDPVAFPWSRLSSSFLSHDVPLADPFSVKASKPLALWALRESLSTPHLSLSFQVCLLPSSFHTDVSKANQPKQVSEVPATPKQAPPFMSLWMTP